MRSNRLDHPDPTPLPRIILSTQFSFGRLGGHRAAHRDRGLTARRLWASREDGGNKQRQEIIRRHVEKAPKDRRPRNPRSPAGLPSRRASPGR
jgi:hypothetical protein